MTILEQISHETMVFMRGRYRLDEIGDGRGILKFMQGRRSIVTIYIREDRFTFLIVFGKKESECFEVRKGEFSKWIRDHYDNAKTCRDGRRVYIDVNTLEQLEEIKKLILIKKKPNQKPFPKENVIFSDHGQRGDQSVHYIQTDEELQTAMKNSMIHTEIHYADEITWGILPYVPMHYE